MCVGWFIMSSYILVVEVFRNESLLSVVFFNLLSTKLFARVVRVQMIMEIFYATFQQTCIARQLGF